ncbi:MAG: phosphotransferase [Chitinophagales bacterium]|nr:phosphotransferase [Chitinophagales bacterium]
MKWDTTPILTFIKTVFQQEPQDFVVLPLAGSDRRYGRFSINGASFIATYNPFVPENKAFIYFSKVFREKGLPVPEVLFVYADQTMYIQTDLGNQALLDVLTEKGLNEDTYLLYQETVKNLAKLQVVSDEGLDYSYCYAGSQFDKDAIIADLNYFKYYFLRAQKIVYDGEQLNRDFNTLAEWLVKFPLNFFMLRDCQARNIMVNEGKPYFIDFQGGKKGPLVYDIASLLWQAKAALPLDWKNSLFDTYCKELQKYLPNSLDVCQLKDYYNGFVLIRLLQVLGAYGFRGLFEKRQHFIESIPLALENLKSWLEACPITIDIPEIISILRKFTQDEFIQKFVTIKAKATSKLVVYISSFSYKKGIPIDESGNGGGFVFDCRGILNPGRFEEYKKLSGQDKAVQEFLLTKTEMPQFLEHVKAILDISIKDYLERDFGNLMVNFGCTGGQHRSVFAAETIQKYLQQKFGVETVLLHNNQTNWVR